MAADKHHSGFDKDEFDRYDTFDASVSEGVDPNRQGQVGELGWLIDKIRTKNAADKLDENVSLGEDRALTDAGNWAAVPHRELYESVHTNNDPTEAYALAREWTDLGNMMAENSRVMDDAIRSTESGWQGEAAQVAREATLRLATWGGDAAQTSQYMGTRIADQGLAAERAKAAMPEPVEFDYNQMLRQGFATGSLGGLARAAQDVQAASVQARTAHGQAVTVMTEMETQSRTVDETTPRFVRPPEIPGSHTANGEALMLRSAHDTSPATAVANPQLATFAATGGSGMPGGAGGGGVPGGTGGGGFGTGFGAGAPAAASLGQPAPGNPQSYVPPNIPLPDVPGGGSYSGTTAAGYTPPVPGTGGHPSGTSLPGTGYPTGGNPGGGQYTGPYVPGGGYPSGGSGRNQSGMPPGHLPPRPPGSGYNPNTGAPIPPGGDPRRGIPSFGGGGSAGGGAGGFGPRGAASLGGAGLGGGFGESAARPGASVAGAPAETAMRNANAAAAAGRSGAPGAAGMGGGMGGMGGGGRGEEDKEHRTKYATGEKVVEEPGRMVPQVIGEKSARQLRDEPE